MEHRRKHEKGEPQHEDTTDHRHARRARPLRRTGNRGGLLLVLYVLLVLERVVLGPVLLLVVQMTWAARHAHEKGPGE